MRFVAAAALLAAVSAEPMVSAVMDNHTTVTVGATSKDCADQCYKKETPGSRCNNDCDCDKGRSCSQWNYCQYCSAADQEAMDVGASLGSAPGASVAEDGVGNRTTVGATSKDCAGQCYKKETPGSRCNNDCDCDQGRSCSQWNYCQYCSAKAVVV